MGPGVGHRRGEKKLTCRTTSTMSSAWQVYVDATFPVPLLMLVLMLAPLPRYARPTSKQGRGKNGTDD